MKTLEKRSAFALTPMQAGMFFHSLKAPRSGVDVEQVICRLDEPFDLLSFKKAWQRLIDRHEALRMRFGFGDSGSVLQFPLIQVKLSIDEYDWSSFLPENQNQFLEDYLEKDRMRGFDPRSDTLVRLAVFKLDETRCCFVWTWWHGVLDGRARFILLEELLKYYEVFRRGGDIELPTPRPFTDFVEWVTELDTASGMTFWRDLLEGFSDPTRISSNHSSTATENGDFAWHDSRISQAVASQLNEFAKAHDVTVSTAVHGAWALVLSKYTGQNDIVFGSTRACRYSAFGGDGSGDGIVGVMINTLPLRVKIGTETVAADLVRELRMQQLAIREYEHSSLVDVQACSGIRADRSLFESIVVFERQDLDSALRSRKTGLETARFEIRGCSGYPITLYVYGGTEMLLQICNDRNRMDDRSAVRMMAHFVEAIRALAECSRSKVSDLSILTASERHQILTDWNSTQAGCPRDRHVHHLFEIQAERTPDATAVVDEGESLSYAQLNARSNQLAHHLRGLGVGPGVLAGICLERSVEMVVGVLGVLKAGGAYVPLDPAFPQDRLAFIAADAGLKLIVTQESLEDLVPVPGATSVCLDTDWNQIRQQPTHNPKRTAGPEDLVYVLYTSGSTGKPKGVEIPHRALTNFLWSMKTEPGFTKKDILLAVTTLSFDISGLELFLPLIVGGRIELTSRRVAADGRLLQEKLNRCGATMMQATPATWRMLIETGWEGTPGLTALCGGEGLPRELANQLLERTTALWNMYGPTETTIWSSVQKISENDAEISIGRPIANTEFYILDKNLQPLPTGVPGELFIGGDGLARGYWNRPELTSERFIPHPFSREPGARVYRTGDLAKYREDGQVIHMGRLDYQVKVRGFRIELGEIEAILDEHPSVQKNVVVARERKGGGRETFLAAYIVPEPETAPTVGELRRFLQEKLPDYMVPSVFVHLETLPLTPNGKVDRRALPETDQETMKLESAYVAPRTSTEAILAEIWKKVLKVEKIGVNDNFFELGGHSLLATQMISRINGSFDIELPLRSLVESPTVSGLAAAIAQEQAERADGDALAAMLAELEKLPSDEAKALLAAELEKEANQHD